MRKSKGPTDVGPLLSQTLKEALISAKGGELRAEGVYVNPTFARSEPDAGRGQKDHDSVLH